MKSTSHVAGAHCKAVPLDGELRAHLVEDEIQCPIPMVRLKSPKYRTFVSAFCCHVQRSEHLDVSEVLLPEQVIKSIYAHAKLCGAFTGNVQRVKSRD